MIEKFKFGLIFGVLALTACGSGNGKVAPSADAPFSAAKADNVADSSSSDAPEGTNYTQKTGYIMLLNGQGGHVGHFKATIQVPVKENEEEDSTGFDAPLSIAGNSITFTTEEGQSFRWGGEYMYSDQPFSMTIQGIQFGWPG